MAIINLNDTTPAPPSGKVNVKWQADASTPRNVSAYIDMPLAAAAISETPAGTLDGVNRAFVLSFTPSPGSLQHALNGIAQTPGIDYSLVGPTITYTVPPVATDLHYSRYLH
jgi:hypothetical protein